MAGRRAARAAAAQSRCTASPGLFLPWRQALPAVRVRPLPGAAPAEAHVDGCALRQTAAGEGRGHLPPAAEQAPRPPLPKLPQHSAFPCPPKPGFLDADEFIILRPDIPSLPALLRLHEQHGGLVLFQKGFGSSGHRARPPGGVRENYLHCMVPSKVRKQGLCTHAANGVHMRLS